MKTDVEIALQRVDRALGRFFLRGNRRFRRFEARKNRGELRFRALQFAAQRVAACGKFGDFFFARRAFRAQRSDRIRLFALRFVQLLRQFPLIRLDNRGIRWNSNRSREVDGVENEFDGLRFGWRGAQTRNQIEF